MFRNRFLYTLMVVFIALSFAATPALADFEEPDLSNSSLMPDDYVPPEGLMLTDATAPYPLSPIESDPIFNRTPKLYFTRNEQATAYKIYMYDFRTHLTLLYTFVGGTENCGTAYCWLKPPTKLKTWKYDETSGGNYAWRVSAKIDGSWVHNASYDFFTVLSKGFTSTFDVNTRGWEMLNGTWKRTPAGLYKMKGITGTNVNAWNKEYFMDDLVIEVRMKRKVETGSANRIYFLGYPNPRGDSDRWNKGYCFIYYNNGNWSIYKYIYNDSVYVASGTTVFDETLNWNTIKFWVHNDTIYIWMNGVYIGAVVDNSLSAGAVGLAMYETNPDLSPLLVDYVKVYYSALWPDEIPLEEIVIKAPEFELSPGGDYIIQ